MNSLWIMLAGVGVFAITALGVRLIYPLFHR